MDYLVIVPFTVKFKGDKAASAMARTHAARVSAANGKAAEAIAEAAVLKFWEKVTIGESRSYVFANVPHWPAVEAPNA